MKLLIIGASGFIGNNIYLNANKRCFDVIGTQFQSNSNELIKFDMLTQKITDILPSSFFQNKEPVYAVICSAIPKIDKCYTDKNLSYALNVTNTVSLLNSLKELGIKFAFLSTEAVFDGSTGYYHENIPPSPINEYGKHKVEVERYILSEMPENLIFRLSMVVGSTFSKGHLFYDWYQKVLSNEPIMCIKGQIFSPTYVDDVSEGIFKAFEKNLSGIYHLTNPEYFQREELARQFLIELNSSLSIIVKEQDEFAFQQRRSLKTYLDGTKFRKATDMNFTSMKEVIYKFKTYSL